MDEDGEAPVGLAHLGMEGLWWELLGRLKPGYPALWLWGCSLELRKLTLGVTQLPWDGPTSGPWEITLQD